MTVVTSTAASTVVPRMSKLTAANRFQEFQKLVLQLIGFGLAVGIIGTIGAAAIGVEVIERVYGTGFAEFDVLIATTVAATFVTTFRLAGASLQAAREFQRYTLSLIPLLIISVLTAYYFTNAGGIAGAAWSMAVSFGLGLLLLSYQLSGVARRAQPASPAQGTVSI